MGATTKTIYLTRHAEGEHNANDTEGIPDAYLTSKGEQQCAELHKRSEAHIQQKGELVVCSPLRRTMQTMLLSYPRLVKRLREQGNPPYLLDIVQEVKAVPSDTPSYPVEKLMTSKDGMFDDLDFSTLSPEYASKEGIYHPDNVRERAKQVRKWLRSRKEQHIVVVAHGDILRVMIDGTPDEREWDNCEVKTFTFASDDDEDANMVEIPINRDDAQTIVDDLVTNAMSEGAVDEKKEHVPQEVMAR